MTMEEPSLDDLSAVEFEEFCFHLMVELGFVNVDWRKGTGLNASPSDGGRDIVAERQMSDVDGHKYRETWFVDCKHHKKGVPPDEVSGLLAWGWAQRANVALVIASHYLSNPCKDHLREYELNNRPPFRIRHWERPQLVRLMGGVSDSTGLFAPSRTSEAEASTSLDSELGSLEWLALYEETMPIWTQTDVDLARALNSIADLMNQAAGDIKASDSKGRGYAGRLRIDRELAKELAPIAENVYALSEQSCRHLRDVDPGLREHIAREIALAKEQPDEGPRICRQFESTRSMAEAILGSLAANEKYLDQRKPSTSQTRDMRPVQRLLDQAAKVRTEGKDLVEGWLRIIDTSGLDCEDTKE